MCCRSDQGVIQELAARRRPSRFVLFFARELAAEDALIRWLVLMRLDHDVVEIAWHHQGLAETVLAFIGPRNSEERYRGVLLS